MTRQIQGHMPFHLLIAAVTLVSIGMVGCSSTGGAKDELTAARLMLANNPEVEVVATDDKAGVFTVRVKSTGQLIMVTAADAAQGKSLVVSVDGVAAQGGGTVTVAAAQRPGGQSATVSNGQASVTARTGNAQTPQDASVAVATRGDRGVVTVETDRGTARVTASGVVAAGGRGVDVGTERQSVSVSADGQNVTVGGTRAGKLTVTADGETVDIGSRKGSVTVTNDGQTVTVGGNAGVRVTQASGADAGADAGRARRSQAYQCGGGESLRIDNQVIETSGTAVSAQGGCTVVITNSHIVTTGIGVQAGGGATVSIENSVIEGRGSAVSVNGGATVSAAGSTLTGGVSKSGLGSFVDRGGNRLR